MRAVPQSAACIDCGRQSGFALTVFRRQPAPDARFDEIVGCRDDVAVQHVARVAELDLLAETLARQLCLGIGVALVGFIAALLATEDHRLVAGVVGRGLIGPAVLPLEALERGPRLDQLAAGGESSDAAVVCRNTRKIAALMVQAA